MQESSRLKEIPVVIMSSENVPTRINRLYTHIPCPNTDSIHICSSLYCLFSAAYTCFLTCLCMMIRQVPEGRRRGFPAEARPPGRRVAPVQPRPPVSTTTAATGSMLSRVLVVLLGGCMAWGSSSSSSVPKLGVFSHEAWGSYTLDMGEPAVYFAPLSLVSLGLCRARQAASVLVQP
jgi:hypothetical protein